MILTNDDALAEQCRGLRNLCFNPNKRFVHDHLGWNLRMTNLQAALGMAQLERLNEFLKKKRWIGNFYNELFADIEGVQLPFLRTDYAENLYWVFGVLLDESICNSEQIRFKLAQAGIGTRPFFYPLHLQPVLKRMGLLHGQKYPIAERLYSQGLYLPSGLALTEEQIRIVAKTFKKVLNEVKS